MHANSQHASATGIVFCWEDALKPLSLFMQLAVGRTHAYRHRRHKRKKEKRQERRKKRQGYLKEIDDRLVGFSRVEEVLGDVVRVEGRNAENGVQKNKLVEGQPHCHAFVLKDTVALHAKTRRKKGPKKGLETKRHSVCR